MTHLPAILAILSVAPHAALLLVLGARWGGDVVKWARRSKRPCTGRTTEPRIGSGGTSKAETSSSPYRPGQPGLYLPATGLPKPHSPVDSLAPASHRDLPARDRIAVVGVEVPDPIQARGRVGRVAPLHQVVTVVGHFGAPVDGTEEEKGEQAGHGFTGTGWT